MAKYKYGKGNISSQDKTEKSKTIFKVAVVTLLLLVPAVVYIVLSVLPPNPVTGRSIDRGLYNPNITFTTDWFEFEAPNRWEELTAQHIPDKMYVFREKNGGELLALLKVFVNDSPVPFQDYYTNVLPVEIVDGNRLRPKSLEPHCSEATPQKEMKGTPLDVSQGGTTFTCWVDNKNFIAVAGEIGGTDSFKLRRENGESASYKIIYQNTAFSPSRGSFEEVMRSFTAR